MDSGSRKRVGRLEWAIPLGLLTLLFALFVAVQLAVLFGDSGYVLVVFLMVLVAGIRLRAAWLPRAVVGAGVLALVGLAAANPDGMIADRNVARYEQIRRIDTAYLSTLSADAVPGLDRLGTIAPEKRDCALLDVADDLAGRPDDWRGWSYGRAHARDMLRVDPPARNGNCH